MRRAVACTSLVWLASLGGSLAFVAVPPSARPRSSFSGDGLARAGLSPRLAQMGAPSTRYTIKHRDWVCVRMFFRLQSRGLQGVRLSSRGYCCCCRLLFSRVVFFCARFQTATPTATVQAVVWVVCWCDGRQRRQEIDGHASLWSVLSLCA